MRRGPEGADTPLYCDAFPTHTWNGEFLGSREGEGNKAQCKWDYTIPKQCFAFGPERLLKRDGSITMTTGEGNERMNTKECKQGCCADSTCNSWQEFPGRGCYFGKSDCKHETAEGVYDGGRKCLPSFCDGKENQILLPSKIESLQAFVLTLKQE